MTLDPAPRPADDPRARSGPGLTLGVFVIAARRCAVPVSTIERVLPMASVSPLPGAPAVVLGILNVHGRILPVVDFRRRLDLAPADYGVAARLLIVTTSRRTLAVPVDQVLGVIEVREDSVVAPGALLSGVAHLAGITALPDGLLFIHDLEAFLSLDEGRQLGQALDEMSA